MANKVNCVMLLWVLAPCTLVGEWQRFGEVYCLHLEDSIFVFTLTTMKTSALTKLTVLRRRVHASAALMFSFSPEFYGLIRNSYKIKAMLAKPFKSKFAQQNLV
jgi:hypothetical protein